MVLANCVFANGVLAADYFAKCVLAGVVLSVLFCFVAVYVCRCHASMCCFRKFSVG